jgi:hypothetical protein
MRGLRGVWGWWSENKGLMRNFMRVAYLGPLLVGFAVMVFFAVIAQSREVYLGLIEDQQVVQGVLGIAVVVLLCGLLGFWQSMLTTAAIDRIYPEHADPSIDRSLLRFRDRLCLISSILPLAGLGLGLLKLIFDVWTAHQHLERALQSFGIVGLSEFAHTVDTLRWFPLAVVLTLFVGGLFAAALRGLLTRITTRAVQREFLQRLVMWTGIGIAGLAVIAPVVLPDYVVFAARTAGPLACGTIVMIVVVCVLMLLSYLSNRLRWPVTGTFMLALLIWGGFETYKILTARQSVERDTEPRDPKLQDLRPLYVAFEQWFEARQQVDSDKYARYPVFIVSAQGGGIYAASATSTFLAGMQDRCPVLSQHIFAISGVSGGAIGAALFGALEAGKPLLSEAGCATTIREDEVELVQRARRVVQGDHLSPAVAMIWPDIVREVFPLTGAVDTVFGAGDRSSLLERSMACAFDPDKYKYRCPAAHASNGSGLREPFANYWLPVLRAPALIPNATWVETGFRAAFAPFPLYAMGDGTLYDFGTDFAAKGAEIKNPAPSLIEAASVSARFPGMSPAWRADVMLKPSNQPRSWNFVDGGYVDNSGASTALELYRALNDLVSGKASYKSKIDLSKVDLYLVMLTDAKTELSPVDIADGAGFSDAVAPVTALLNVREQLAGRAVTRAVEEVRAGENARGGGRHVFIVNLTQKTFPLPLGWKISRTTNDIVRFMLGSPDLCGSKTNASEGNQDIADAIEVIEHNSCVKRDLVALLNGLTPQ